MRDDICVSDGGQGLQMDSGDTRACAGAACSGAASSAVAAANAAADASGVAEVLVDAAVGCDVVPGDGAACKRPREPADTDDELL